MKKILAVILASMLFFTVSAFAGGGKVCGDKAQGSAGTDGGGDTTQNRAPAGD